MLKTDVQALATSLNEMADAFDRKHMTEGATKVWFETLREFPAEMVLGFLKAWPKLHTKFPPPAEVWKALNEASISNREKAADDLRKQAQEPVRFARTPEGKRALDALKVLLEKPARSPMAHWLHVLKTHKPQTVGHDYATAALANFKWRKREEPMRQPGEDIEEFA